MRAACIPWRRPAGLLLYFADLVLRAGQLANMTTITAAAVPDDESVATIQLKASKARRGPQRHLPAACGWNVHRKPAALLGQTPSLGLAWAIAPAHPPCADHARPPCCACCPHARSAGAGGQWRPLEGGLPSGPRHLTLADGEPAAPAAVLSLPPTRTGEKWAAVLLRAGFCLGWERARGRRG